MATSDPIAEFLTRIRNAVRAKHRYIDIGWSNVKEQLAKVLHDEGFIERYMVQKEGTTGTLRVILRYAPNRESVINALDRVSRPGRRQYVQREKIPFVMSGVGITIISTSKGLMSGRNAHKQNIGGELMCKVW